MRINSSSDRLLKILGEAQPVPADLQRADRLLEGLLVVLAEAHHFADGQHLRAQLVRQPGELLEGPAGELDHHVVARGRVLLQRSHPPVGDLVHRHAAGQQRRDVGDREAGGLGGQRRRARGARIDLDHHDAAGLRIVGELDVRAADHLDRLDDVVRVLLQFLLQFLVDGQHRGRAVGVARVDAHRIDVLDEADGDHLVLGVADDFQFQLFPAQDRLLDQDLSDQAGGQPALGDGAELLHVVDQAAAGAAHRVGRPDHRRQADPLDDCSASSRLWAISLRGISMPSRFIVSLKAWRSSPRSIASICTPITRTPCWSSTPAAHSSEDRFRPDWPPRFGNSASGFSLAMISATQSSVSGSMYVTSAMPGIGHDRGRIGVDQHDLVAQPAQGLAGLRAGVVELAGLTDHDRPGADDHHLLNVVAFGHNR